MTRQYHYFDAVISSRIALDELDEFSGGYTSPVVEVEAPTRGFQRQDRAWAHQWLDEPGNVIISLAVSDDQYVLEFPHLGCFFLSKDGLKITCRLAEHVSESTFAHLLLDQVLPRYFAHFHNYLVLHGSCVSVGGRGICFLGKSGWGKSTISAAFLQQGQHLLTDDCLALRQDGEHVIGIPSYCGVRLLPDSLAHFTPRHDGQQSPVADYTAKQRFRPQVEELGRVPLAGVFALNNPDDDCSDIQAAPLHGVAAITELLRDNFCLNPNDPKWQKTQFSNVAEILASLRIFSLHYPRSYESLPEVVEAITGSI